MYAMRNDKFYLMTLVSNIVSPSITTEKKVSKNLKSLLTGRMFATCLLVTDLLNTHEKETTLYMNRVVATAFDTLHQEQLPLSVKLSACRCLVKLLRKMP